LRRTGRYGEESFEIVLSVEERAELQRRVAAYNAAAQVVQRAKMILYAAEG